MKKLSLILYVCVCSIVIGCNNGKPSVPESVITKECVLYEYKNGLLLFTCKGGGSSFYVSDAITEYLSTHPGLEIVDISYAPDSDKTGWSYWVVVRECN